MSYTVIAQEGFDWSTGSYSIRNDLWASNSMSSQTGRFGGRAGSNGNGTTKALSGITDTVGLRFAFKPPSVSAGNTWDFKDASGNLHVRVQYNFTTKCLEIVTSSVVRASGSTILTAGLWYWVDIQVKIADSGGQVFVRVEGNAETSWTGDTKIGAGSTAQIFTLTSTSAQIDDVVIYVPDTINVDWPPDLRITTKSPNGAGSVAQWTPTGAATNWKAAEVQNGDTSYNADSTPGHRDLYAMSAASPVGAVIAVAVGLAARKDDAATRQVRTLLNIGGTDYPGVTKTLTSSFEAHSDLYLTNPATGLAWTLAAPDTIEAGVEEIA